MRKKPSDPRNSLASKSNSQLPSGAMCCTSSKLFTLLCNAASVTRRSVTSCWMAIKWAMAPLGSRTGVIDISSV